MRRLAYTRPHALDKLHDELLTASLMPELVEGDGAKLWLTFPDNVDQAAVDKVVTAHDPTPPPPPADPNVELEQAITAATTLEELKAALLGKTRSAKAAGRPL